MRIRITPSAVSGIVSSPPSKSYTHRALILGSLAQGETVIENYLASDDTRYTIDACRSLGTKIQSADKTLKIMGRDGQFSVEPGQNRVFVGNSGSTIRMVAPLAALSTSRVVFDGEPRLHQRPIGDLLSALQDLGIQARSIANNGYPPIEVQGGRLLGGEIVIKGVASSQHISSLLMIAPYAELGVKIRIIGELHSKPYLDITIDVMRQFGVEAENHDYQEFSVRNGQRYQGRHYRIEGDYSAAAYFLAMGAIGQGAVTVGNLKADSVQGDRHFLALLSKMGCLVDYQPGQIKVARGKELIGITVDMGDYPDIVQPLTIVAAYATGRTKIINIGHLRYKETDRLNNTAAELRKMGIKADVTESTMSINGGKPKGAMIETYNDHRMAMSFATAALFADGDTIINGAEAVKKSYPEFFTDLAKIGVRLKEL